MNIFKQTGALILISILMLTAVSAADSAPIIKVGIVPSPPFAMKNSKGEWEGISIDLWKAVTEKLGAACEYQEYDFTGLVKSLADGTLDAGVGRISALEMHDPRIDFTHAYFFSGLAFAAPKLTEKQHWLAVWSMLCESNFLILAFLILLTLILSGASIWFLERGHHTGHFSKDLANGIGSGIWWAAGTIFTVGYGDKVPGTFGGRLLAILWMIGGIVLVSVFTATITSMCTVSRLGNVYERPEALQDKRLGVVVNSPAETFIQKSGFDYQKMATTPEALKLLAEGKIDMVVEDQSVLKYYSRQKKIAGVTILPHLLTLEGYSFALTENSPLRNPLNQAIKEYTALPGWQNILSKYLGH